MEYEGRHRNKTTWYLIWEAVTDPRVVTLIPMTTVTLAGTILSALAIRYGG